MSGQVRIDRDGALTSGETRLGRIVSWQPPVLLVERDGEVRRVFLATGERGASFTVDGQGHELPSPTRAGASTPGGAEAGGGELTAPMPGRVLEVLVAVGDTVEAGQRLLVLEAMKMETPVRAPTAGVVRALLVEAGGPVEMGQLLLELDAHPGPGEGEA